MAFDDGHDQYGAVFDTLTSCPKKHRITHLCEQSPPGQNMYKGLFFMTPGLVIHRYIFRELIPPFLISIATLMFIFLMTELLDIMDWVVNYRVSFLAVLKMVVFLMPSILQFVIPMSAMMAILLTFLKMSGDNEIIALKAVGTSIYGMLPPVIAFCLICSIFTGFITVYGLPWSKSSVKALEKALNTTSITALLKERTFNDSFRNRVFYASKINPRQNALEGVFIEDRSISSQSVTIVAPRGYLVEDADNQAYYLQLEQGQINQVDIKTRKVNPVNFDKGNIRLELSRYLMSSARKPKEMSIAELRVHIQSFEQKNAKYYLAVMALHQKLSIPFACFALGLLAVPLGIQSKSARRSFGIGLGLFFFLGYYLMLSAGLVLGEAGRFPPLLGMWTPNIVMGGIGCYLLIRCARERTISINGLLFFFTRLFARSTGADEPAGRALKSVDPEP